MHDRCSGSRKIKNGKMPAEKYRQRVAIILPRDRMPAEKYRQRVAIILPRDRRVDEIQQRMAAGRGLLVAYSQSFRMAKGARSNMSLLEETFFAPAQRDAESLSSLGGLCTKL